MFFCLFVCFIFSTSRNVCGFFFLIFCCPKVGNQFNYRWQDCFWKRSTVSLISYYKLKETNAVSVCFGCRAAPPHLFTRAKAFVSVSNEAVKLELDFLDQASFTEFNTLTLLVTFINTCLSSKFFSYDFSVADTDNAVLIGQTSVVQRRYTICEVSQFSIKHCKHSLPFFKLLKGN